MDCNVYISILEMKLIYATIFQLHMSSDRTNFTEWNDLYDYINNMTYLNVLRLHLSKKYLVKNLASKEAQLSNKSARLSKYIFSKICGKTKVPMCNVIYYIETLESFKAYLDNKKMPSDDERLKMHTALINCRTNLYLYLNKKCINTLEKLTYFNIHNPKDGRDLNEIFSEEEVKMIFGVD